MLFLFVFHRNTDQGIKVKMNNQGQVDMLRCWKCRKYIDNTDCIITDQTTDLFEVSF